ncbi:MAG: nuclear transport factor 2 family protein [Chloracidobacterium sp.]|nr:nuclear transport factor 2 family protein [Chloracidobacterium sp.]
MKRIFFVAAFILAVSAVAFAQQKNAKLEATLIEMDKAWTAAELKGDMKAISTYVADDYQGTTPDGKTQTKAQYLAEIKATKDTDVADEYAVRFFGDVAIMTHRGTVKGEKPVQYRSTHVWVNRGGKWMIVSHHSSEIAADAAKPAPKEMAAPTEKRKPRIAPLSTSSPATDEAKPDK